MTNILIYKDRDDHDTDHENIDLLLRRFESAAFCSRNIDSLKEHIANDKIQVLIILTHHGISKKLEEFLDKCKNHINLHDALLVIVHTPWTSSDAQTCLMLGAGFLLEEPLDLNFLTDVIKNHISKTEFDLKIGYLQLESPLECQIDSFGRIGRIDKKAPGNIFIETSLDFQLGAKIQIHNLLARDLKEKTLSYLVKDKNSRGLYYRYAYQYHLEWEKNTPLEEAYQIWLAAHLKQMSVPKVKVLFVLGGFKSGTPFTLDTNLFSSYSVSSEKLTQEFLERIDPQIIIKESLPKLHEHILKEWITPRQSEKLLIEESNLLLEETEEKKQLRDRVLKSIIPFTRSNAIATHDEFFYLNRKSEYSRLAVSSEAEILAISRHHLLLLSTTNYAPSATLQVFLSSDNSPIFLRVLRTNKSVRDAKWEVNCSIFYLSEVQRNRIVGEKNKLLAYKDKPNKTSKYLSVEKRVGFLGQSKKFSILFILTFIGIAFAICIILIRVNSNKAANPAVTEGEPGDLADSINEFQNSVRKSFGEPTKEVENKEEH